MDQPTSCLAISTVRPAAGQVIADLLVRGRGLDLIEPPAAESELGAPARAAAGAVIAVVRDDEILACDHPRRAADRRRPAHRNQLTRAARGQAG